MCQMHGNIEEILLKIVAKLYIDNKKVNKSPKKKVLKKGKKSKAKVTRLNSAEYVYWQPKYRIW